VRHSAAGPGDAVEIASGNFQGLSKPWSRASMPNRDRVAVLMEFLDARPTLNFPPAPSSKPGTNAQTSCKRHRESSGATDHRCESFARREQNRAEIRRAAGWNGSEWKSKRACTKHPAQPGQARTTHRPPGAQTWRLAPAEFGRCGGRSAVKFHQP